MTVTCIRCGRQFSKNTRGGFDICHDCERSETKARSRKSGKSMFTYVLIGLIGAFIYLVINYWLHSLIIGIITISCIIICVTIKRKAEKPRGKIIVTIFIGICLIISLFFVLPIKNNENIQNKIENENN